MPLRITFQVVDGACAPVPGARVDLWHTDATGHYSGYRGQGDGWVSTEGETFLRGSQFADGNGTVTFVTIYPGWYRGRTTHMHLKVFRDTSTVLTGQAYFEDALSDRIYAAAAPYNERTAMRDTWNGDDGVLARARGGPENFVSIEEAGDGFVAAMVLGVGG